MKTKTFFIVLVMSIFLIDHVYSQTKPSDNYGITVTKVAKMGKGGPEETDLISGKVTGTNLTSLQIVIYTKAGGKWWVQPTTENPYTLILSNGTWQNEIYLGNQYAILLVTKSFKPKNTLTTLPQTDNSVKAIEVVNAVQ
jgi:hypothetical protein